MVKVRKDLSGLQFNRLKVIRQSENDYIKSDGRREVKWICKCDCGKEIAVRGNDLKTNHTKSCGCLVYETSSKIGKQSKGIKRKDNIYDLSGEYGIGYAVNNNTIFYFDLEDYELIKNYTWSEHNGYIRTTTENKEILMHRLVMKVTDNKIVVDHCGHNTVDNRKSKLRVTTSIGNQKNKSLSKNNKSGVTGVCWDKKVNKWHSYIWKDGKCLHLGRFENFDDACAIRKKAEDKYFGDFSYENSMKIYKESDEINENI